jgi:hypothetical protein
MLSSAHPRSRAMKKAAKRKGKGGTYPYPKGKPKKK